MEVGGEKMSVALECQGLGKAEALNLGVELPLTLPHVGGCGWRAFTC